MLHVEIKNLSFSYHWKKINIETKDPGNLSSRTKKISITLPRKLQHVKYASSWKCNGIFHFLFSASEIVLLALLRVDFNEFNPFFFNSCTSVIWIHYIVAMNCFERFCELLKSRGFRLLVPCKKLLIIAVFWIIHFLNQFRQPAKFWNKQDENVC